MDGDDARTGPKKLYVSYYRKRVYADLLVDGSIRFKDIVYTSPVPCALQMKRSLNPSLKTDAGWSSMFSAASGESLKDIKDRLNIRKRGPNSRTTSKEKKVVALPSATPTSKDRLVNAAVEISRLAVIPKCPVCRKEATADAAMCNACQGKTHFRCAQPALTESPSTPWFCDKCLTSQADGILEFLQQTRRILVEKMEAAAKDKPLVKDSLKKELEEGPIDASTPDAESTTMRDDDNDESPLPMKEDAVSEEKTEALEPIAKADEGTETAEEPLEEEQTVDKAETGACETNGITDAEPVEEKGNQVATVVAERVTPSSPEEKFLGLIDSLIEEVSSRKDRMNIIANSTGATLVHLSKTLLVQLVESGNRDILEATKETIDDDEADEDAVSIGSSSSRTSEVDALVKIFDLRHQILSSQAQFKQTTSALSARTEKRLRVVEAELMQLEEARATEASAVTKIVDLIEKYDQDLQKCKQKIQLNNVILESIIHRRNFIRSSNINNLFVPSYRLNTKQMTTSSDQLLYTVLLDKLRTIAKSINEWAKMEAHFEKMTSSLQETLVTIGTKRPRDLAFLSKKPLTPALFSRVKIPPSRRLIERQITNYEVNMTAIRINRADTRKTLAGVLKIAREEHLSQEIIDLTDLLYQKCRPMKGEEDEESKLEDEEIDDSVEEKEDEEPPQQEEQSEEQETEEPEQKKQRLEDPPVVDASTTPDQVNEKEVQELPVVEIVLPEQPVSESLPVENTEAESKVEQEDMLRLPTLLLMNRPKLQ
uniref:Zinc finger PHD-type domain-containing protein n=1 Tax=Globisporangium ultimum (strain ATCC 200006 / CBS 805.95 / DAOM BR144) TaxID=431595 RepID=K3X329_GLOUD